MESNNCGLQLLAEIAGETVPCELPNGLEMSRPASAWIVHRNAQAAAGRVGSIELFGGGLTVLLGEGVQELVSFD